MRSCLCDYLRSCREVDYLCYIDDFDDLVRVNCGKHLHSLHEVLVLLSLLATCLDLSIHDDGFDDVVEGGLVQCPENAVLARNHSRRPWPVVQQVQVPEHRPCLVALHVLRVVLLLLPLALIYYELGEAERAGLQDVHSVGLVALPDNGLVFGELALFHGVHNGAEVFRTEGVEDAGGPELLRELLSLLLRLRNHLRLKLLLAALGFLIFIFFFGGDFFSRSFFFILCFRCIFALRFFLFYGFRVAASLNSLQALPCPRSLRWRLFCWVLDGYKSAAATRACSSSHFWDAAAEFAPPWARCCPSASPSCTSGFPSL
eukprot:TRINITY_DN380_c0_g1_i4.p1 TRINITY_DN380_c0_g1~~TRINITY_DN380_c0_g1_i4.p1  ORF type:complete len:316 (+),score=3.11 TRINITY_DN380_c0_g1_i4:520-1467(+)